MLMIRLRRGGAKHNPVYRVVVSDSRKDTYGKYLEQVRDEEKGDQGNKRAKTKCQEQPEEE